MPEKADNEKSVVFSKGQIEQFPRQAAEYCIIYIKIVVFLPIFGACRNNKLIGLSINNMSGAGDHPLVRFRGSITATRSIVVVGSDDTAIDALVYYRRYLLLRPGNSPLHLFWHINKTKVLASHLGEILWQHTFKIAEILKLTNVHEFTSHALKRSSATWMADGGVNHINLKRFVGWMADSAVQGYIAEGTVSKKCKRRSFEDNNHSKWQNRA